MPVRQMEVVKSREWEPWIDFFPFLEQRVNADHGSGGIIKLD
jgi:hypothetical protein